MNISKIDNIIHIDLNTFVIMCLVILYTLFVILPVLTVVSILI